MAAGHLMPAAHPSEVRGKQQSGTVCARLGWSGCCPRQRLDVVCRVPHSGGAAGDEALGDMRCKAMSAIQGLRQGSRPPS